MSVNSLYIHLFLNFFSGFITNEEVADDNQLMEFVYHIYPKYSNTLILYHTCHKI